MKKRSKILIGSRNDENVRRIFSTLNNDNSLTVAESWDDILAEINKRCYSSIITDLNLTDCFPSIALDNIQECECGCPIIILLEDVNLYRLYRDRSHFSIEILPFYAVHDTRIVHVLEAAKFRYEMLKSLV